MATPTLLRRDGEEDNHYRKALAALTGTNRLFVCRSQLEAAIAERDACCRRNGCPSGGGGTRSREEHVGWRPTEGGDRCVSCELC